VVYGPPYTAATEEYDGSTWTSNPTGLNTARYELGAAGTQTAALAFGGELHQLQQQPKNGQVRRTSHKNGNGKLI
jgi:hypothetical protein